MSFHHFRICLHSAFLLDFHVQILSAEFCCQTTFCLLQLVEGKAQKESGVRMFYTGWSASTGEADWALSPLFASQNWPPTLFNTAFYSNKQVDSDLAAALQTNDPAQKAKLYKDAQDIIWKESPWIPLVVEKLISAHSTRLTGFWIMPDTGFSFDDADLK